MIDKILYLIHYALLLLFGIALSAVFSGIKHSKKNSIVFSILFLLCGALQLIIYATLSEQQVWMLYPLITHLPTLLLLTLPYRKRIATSIAAITTAYLFCQPAKWFGTLVGWLSRNYIAEYATRIVVLLLTGFIAIRLLAPCLTELYSKDTRSVFIFGIVPIVYYTFDYTTGIYTDFWINSSRVVIEFLPLLLCFVFVLFCIIYFQEYEKKNDAERKEQIIRLTLEQQAKELESVKRSEQEIRMLRHDMRLFLTNLSCHIEEDPNAARKMISGYVASVDATAIQRYCENATINYIISGCASRCRDAGVSFTASVNIGTLHVDETLFCTILSNALDNAFNAQESLPEGQRRIKLMLKTAEGKLLLSLKNTFGKAPIFVDEMPVTNKPGHGYGTKSIRYMSERLGGNCQFTVEGNWFVLRVVI